MHVYLGDPDAGGQLVAETTVSGPLPPWADTLVTLPWTLPETDVPLVLFAVIDPDRLLDDPERSDNRAELTVALPDLTIDSLRWEWRDIDQTQVALTARVINEGVIGAAATTLALREGAADAPLLQGLSVPALAAGGAADIATTWDLSALPGPAYELFLAVDEENGVIESDELDNSSTLLIGSLPAAVTCGDANGDGGVSIVDALAIARHVAGLPPPPAVDTDAADVNADGSISIVDALLIARSVAGLSVVGSCLAP